MNLKRPVISYSVKEWEELKRIYPNNVAVDLMPQAQMIDEPWIPVDNSFEKDSDRV